MSTGPRGGGIFIAVVLAAAIGGCLFPLWLSEHRSAQRMERERLVFTALKNLASAEADFRFNDRDGNRVNDYWTADLSELYRVGLIERGVAEADARPLQPLVPRPAPYQGYFFEALLLDESQSPPEAYAQITDGKSGKVHNLHRFGFVAYPAGPESDGIFLFLINENNTVFRAGHQAIPVPKNWPKDKDLRTFWSKPS